MFPELLSIGFLTIYTYGVCVLVGFIASFYALQTTAKRHNLNLKFLYDHLFSLILVPLILSRIIHIVLNWKLFRTNLIDGFYFWEGGFSLWVTVIGLIVITLFLTTRYNQSFNLWMDNISMAFLLFLSCGMVGYAMSQHGLNGVALGTPTTLPWGVSMNTIYSPFAGVAVHPVLLYQALLSLVLGITGYFLTLKPGRFWTVGWLIFAAFGFFIEFLKWEQRYIIFNVNGNQILACILIIICILGLLYTFRKGTVESHPESPDARKPLFELKNVKK